MRSHRLVGLLLCALLAYSASACDGDPAAGAGAVGEDGGGGAVTADASAPNLPPSDSTAGDVASSPPDTPAAPEDVGAGAPPDVATDGQAGDDTCSGPTCPPTGDPVCDPPCDAQACEACVADDHGDGVCAPMCDPMACEVCNRSIGACESACSSRCEYCYYGACEATGCGDPCEAPNAAGYCDASVLDELALAEAPAPQAGVEGCCCDFTGDGVIDNQLASLLTQLAGMTGYDLPTLNRTLADALADGSFIVLLEYLGLAADAADTPYFDLNLYLGADADGDPTNDFDGDAEFFIRPESLWDGEPLITFEGSTVLDGRLEAGPSQFIVPVSIPLTDPPLDLVLTVDSAILSADITSGADGYELTNGRLCGYVTVQQLFNALNDFAATSCPCLNLAGDLVEGADGEWSCGEADPQCEPSDRMGEICTLIGQYCDTAVLLLPSFLDVDLDDDQDGDAISLGATFGATSAVILGVEPAMK